MLAIFKREFKSYFATPVGYLILAFNTFFLNVFFIFIYQDGSAAIEDVISSIYLIEIFVMPVITMRLFSDDRKQKVDQVLFTAPVRISSIVLGKFFAALALFALSLSSTIFFEITILSHVSANILIYLYALLGSLLLGAALISIGMFISSLTENVAVAGILTFVVDFVVVFASTLAVIINNDIVTEILSKIAFVDVSAIFSVQVFSIPDIVYFLSIIAAFLFLSVRSIDRKRWS